MNKNCSSVSCWRLSYFLGSVRCLFLIGKNIKTYKKLNLEAIFEMALLLICESLCLSNFSHDGWNNKDKKLMLIILIR